MRRQMVLAAPRGRSPADIASKGAQGRFLFSVSALLRNAAS